MSDIQPRLPGAWAPLSPGPAQATPAAAPAAKPAIAPTAPAAAADQARLSSAQGQALPSITLDSTPPVWSAGTKAAIRRGFQSGMQSYGITPQELNSLLRQFGISAMDVNETTIQNPEFNDEIRHIQQSLNQRLNHPELRSLGQGHQITVDGQFGKGTVQALAALRDSLRGEPIQLTVTPLKQQTGTGCYRTAEAMLYNVVHGKDGSSEAYSEFDTRDRIREPDLAKRDINVTASENASGRISVNHQQAMLALDSLDEELEAGRPVIAGVSYRKQDGLEYNEGVTDHFVTITGRGRDAAGSYYVFQDPAQGGSHQLRLDPMTGRLSGKGDMTGIYDVSLIQTASQVDTATVDRYRQLGKVLHTQGQRGSEIQKLQEMLTALGKDTKGTSGAYGNGTAAAVKAFQLEHGLPPNGAHIDSHTAEAIQTAFGALQTSQPDRVMYRRGQASPLLIEVQQALTRAGFSTKGSNGVFGPGTEAALKAFQKAHQLPETGTLDNRCWRLILGQPEGAQA